MNKKLLLGIIAGICVVALVLGLVLGLSYCNRPDVEPTEDPGDDWGDYTEPDYTEPEETIPVVEGGISYYSGLPDYSWYDPTATTKEYTLYTADQLYGLAELVNTMGLKFEGATIKLANNMVINEGDANEWTRYDFMLGWVPLGKSWNNAFGGTIDGQGHYISGLFSVQPKNNAFIAYSQGATVKNLAIVNSYFANTNEDDVQAEVLATFVGRGRGVTLQNLYSDAVLEGGGYSTGGIAGYTQSAWDTVSKDCLIESCVFAGQIKNAIGKSTGGILGHDNGSKYSVTVKNCLFIGSLDSKNANCGGIVGAFSGTSKIINCVSVGKVTSTTKEFNGVALIGSTGSNATVTNSYYVSTKTGKAYGTGTPATDEGNMGLVRATMKGLDVAKVMSGLDFEGAWTEDAAGYPIPAAVKDMYDQHKKPLVEDTSDDSDKPVSSSGSSATVGNADISWYNKDKNEFTLTTVEQLYGLAKLVNEGNNFSGKTVKLGKDLIVNNGTASKWTKDTVGLQGWVSIGSSSAKQFMGTFDGQGHYISGIFSIQAKNNGLFGYAKDATIKNVAVINSYFENTGATSADTRASGQGLGTFVANGENVKLTALYSDAVLKNAGTDLGGIIGYAKGETTVDKCAFAGTILSDGFERRNYGGIVGYNERGVITVSNCLFSGKMDTKTHLQGGIVGRSNVNGTAIKNCVSVGQVKSSHSAAANSNNAIIGAIKADKENTTVTVENCYYITGSKTVNFLENTDKGTAGINETNVVALEDAAVKGEGVASVMTKLDFKSTWSALKDDYPIPTAVKDVYLDTHKAHAHDWAAEWTSNSSHHWHECTGADCNVVAHTDKNGYGEHVFTDEQDDTCNTCGYKRAIFVDDGVPSVYTGTPDTSWYKDDANEFVLTSADQLYGFAQLVNEGKDFAGKTVKLGKNMIINESKVASWASAAPSYKWTPIGAAKDKPFKGTFDGQGKFISGIYSVQKKNNALFAYAIGATVKNVAVIDSYFENTEYTGATAGEKRSSGQNLSAFVAYGEGATLQNLYSNAWLHNGGENVGGICGYAQKGTTIDSCLFTGMITNDAGRESWKIGGIVGFNYDGKITISNVLFSGKIDGKFHLLGGILGRSDVTGTSLDSCVSVGSVVSSSTDPVNKNNGLIGALKNAKVNVKNSYYLTGYRVLGYGEGTGEAVVTDCAALDAAAMKGAAAATAMTKLDFTFKWTALEEDYPVPTAVKEMYESHKARHVCEFKPEWNFDSEYHWHECSDINCEEIKDKAAHDYGTDGTAEKCSVCGHKNPASGCTGTPDTSWYDADSTTKVAYIMTEDQLLGLAKLVNDGTNNFKGWTIYLGDNLIFNEGDASTWTKNTEGLIAWTPVGTNYTDKGFQGTFDGLGHTISGIWSVREKNNALFAYTRNATVMNLSVVNSYFENTGSTPEVLATFVGRGQGVQMSQLYSDAILVGGGYSTGGICGYIQSRESNNTTAAILAQECEIVSCVFAGEIRNASSTCGGILGHDNGKGQWVLVKDCVFSGSITCTTANVGGLVGVFNGESADGTSTLEGCVNTGSITSTVDGWSNVALVGKVSNKAVIRNNRYMNVADVKKFGSGTPAVDENNVGIGPVVVSIQKPTITTQPTGSAYEPNGEAVALKVEAAVSDSGTLTYQWFKSTTSATEGFVAIEGATEATYVPELDADAWYRCEVTNTNLYVGGNKTAKVISDAVKVHIHSWSADWNMDSINHFRDCSGCDELKDKAKHSSADGDDICDICGATIILAAAPQIGGQPAGPVNGAEVGEQVELIVNDATASDGGTLTYQWYSNTTNSAENGTPISGATASTYKFTPAAAGNYYYYCVVTNTNAAEQINETASNVAVIHVHGWESAWVNTDANNHWHECGTDGCPITENSAKNGYGAHNLVHNLCACGYIGPVSYYDATTDFDPNTSGVQHEDTSWYDASKNEFVLSNANQLYGLAKLANNGNTFAGKTITLGCNIVINQGVASTWGAAAPSHSWTPIATSSSYKFKGTFDGDNHYISGVYSRRADNNGLFSFTENCTIENLSLINSYFANYGNTGSSPSGQMLGSIVSRMYDGGTLRNLYSNAYLVQQHKDWLTGGICAMSKNAVSSRTVTIDSCVFAGSITHTGAAGSFVGGILGGTDNQANPVQITNSLIIGTIHTKSNGVGGIAGSLTGNNSKILDCVVASANGSITTTGNNLGAILGQLGKNASTTYTNMAVSDCYYLGVYDKTIGTQVGTLTGLVNNSTSIADANALKQQSNFPGLDFTAAWSMDVNYPVPTGVKGMMDDLKNVMVAATPTINAEPQGAQYNAGATAGALSVEATGDATGILSYQWYKSTTSATDGFTAIAGATGSSYTPDVSASGNAWYYCKVTNTNSVFGGSNDKSSASALVHVHDWDETKYAKNAEYHWNTDCQLANCAGETEPSKMGSYEKHTTYGNHICSECEYVGAASFYDASKGADKSFYNASTYASTNEFHLTNANQLYGLAELVNGGVSFSGKTIYLGVNIVINKGDASTWGTTAPAITDWTPIGDGWLVSGATNYFAGTLDGNGHYISGIYSKRQNNNALIAYAWGANVKNLAVINSYFENTGDSTSNSTNGEILATFVGRGRQTCMTNLYSSATLRNGYVVGGICGYTQKTVSGVADVECVIDSCVFAGDINTSLAKTSGVGGILGHSNNNPVTITNCQFSGSISGNLQSFGGIVGRLYNASSKIENCVSVGTQSTTNNWNSKKCAKAAIIGHMKGFTITIKNCYYLDGMNAVGVLEANGSTAAVCNTEGGGATATTGLNALTTMSNLDATKWTATAGYPVPTGIKEIYSELPLFEAYLSANN